MNDNGWIMVFIMSQDFDPDASMDMSEAKRSKQHFVAFLCQYHSNTVYNVNKISGTVNLFKYQ